MSSPGSADTTTPPDPPTSLPPSSEPPPPTSTPTTISTPPVPSSSPPTTPPTSTSTSTAPPPPPSTQVITSVVSVPASNGPNTPSTVVITQISTPSDRPTSASSRTGTAANQSSTASSRPSEGGGGLSSAGTIAIAVVIPIVAVALLVFAGLFFWRRRKQRKVDEEERRKEMEAYGFNPNNDPTLPAVGGVTDSGDESGYRGWGSSTAAGTLSNRKASTTLSSGNGNPAAYSPGSPNAATDISGEPLVGGAGAGAGVVGAAAVAGAQMSHSHSQSQHSRNPTMDSDTMGPTYGSTSGAVAGGMHSNKAGVQRGPSNASSTYSMGGQSHASNDAPIPVNSNDQYYSDYYQQGPYDNPYGGGHGHPQEAVIRDNPARRNTRIERAPTFPNQGSSGVATNF